MLPSSELFYVVEMSGLALLKKPKNNKLGERYKLKIASTLFAVFIWFLVVTGGTFEYVTTIPISAADHNDRYIVTSEIPKDAQIRLRGQGKFLLAYRLFREGKLFVDFNWESGQNTVRLSKENVLLTGNAKNLTVLELIHPKSFTLFVEERVSKKVRIKPGFTIKTLPGYTLVGDIVLDPPEVKVTGPQSMVDSLAFIKTKTVEWDKQKYPLRRRIALMPPPSHKLSLESEKVAVFADIQKLMEKKIDRVPVQVVNLPPRTSALVIPSTLSLVIEGGVQVIATLDEGDIRATIDYRHQNEEGNKDFPVKLAPIPQVRFRDIRPERFKIVLERR
ncbi:hypothetical protein JW992_02895 [candidate division KSB1 bacterium]|nr:hypothetical protein [candidate division KSB1 bacterium]